MFRSTLFTVFVVTVAAHLNTESRAAELGMGFRVGEVTQDSAIVWTRVTRDADRVWDGFREPRQARGSRGRVRAVRSAGLRQGRGECRR